MARRIAVLAFPDFQILDVAGPLEVFAYASRLIPDADYHVELLARRPGPVRASSGLELIAARGLRQVRAGLDTLLVAGGSGSDAAVREREHVHWLRRMAPRVRRLGSVCTGAFLLAEAGLLDGRRVTTHWASIDRLKDEGDVTVRDNVRFVRDGNLVTSAGVSAGIDMALWLLGQIFDEDFAREVQHGIEYYPAPPYSAAV